MNRWQILVLLVLLLVGGVVLVSVWSGQSLAEQPNDGSPAADVTPAPSAAAPEPKETAAASPSAPPASAATTPASTATPGSQQATATPTTAASVTPTATRGPLVWQRRGLEGIELEALAVSPRRLESVFAGGDGLYRSTDGSLTWAPLDRARSVRQLAISPVDPSVLYASDAIGCAAGVPANSVQSQDGGATWQPLGKDLRAITPSPNDVRVIWAADCTGVVRSNDGGQTWQRYPGAIPLGFDVWRIAVAPSDARVVYVMAVSEGGTTVVSRTTDGGATWQEVIPLGDAWGPVALAIHPNDPQTVYAATGSGVFRSVDGGASWDLLSAGLDALRQDVAGMAIYPIAAFAIDPAMPERLYLGMRDRAGAGEAVYVWSGAGPSWQPLGSGLGSLPVLALAVSGEQLIAATSDGVWTLER